MTMGIPVESLPVTANDDWNTENHAKWLQLRYLKESLPMETTTKEDESEA